MIENLVSIIVVCIISLLAAFHIPLDRDTKTLLMLVVVLSSLIGLVGSVLSIVLQLQAMIIVPKIATDAELREHIYRCLGLGFGTIAEFFIDWIIDAFASFVVMIITVTLRLREYNVLSTPF